MVRRLNKRGVSPVIATVLLVAIVIVIAVIVFLWMRGFLKEPITKFGDENIELACDKVDLDAELNDGLLEISNIGNVPIEKIKLKLVETDGNYKSYTLEKNRLKAGKTLTIIENNIKDEDGNDADINFQDYKGGKIIIIPVLLGKTSSGEEKEYVCPEKNGREVYV